MRAVVYGGGNIGRGFLGQILYESGYETVFIDVNQRLIDQLNADRAYPIKIVCNAYQKELVIKNVRAAHSDGAAAEIAAADIIFTSAGVNVLPKIAPVIKAGLEQRTTGVDMIICENLLHADEYLRGLIQPKENIGLVEASVGRMVPVMTDDMRAGNAAMVWVEPFCTLPVDRAAFRNPIPAIRGMLPSAPFAYYIQSKLYLHNMGHAVAAYIGMRKGYEYIWQTMEDAELYQTVKNAMYAVASALCLEHGKPEAEVLAYADDLLFRFQNKYLGDTTKRVGRDTKRKLAPEDRLLGALALCQKHRVPTDDLKKGIVAALDYLYEREGGC
ncbi:MAG: mannitol dehydrogenase [Clostridiales bacterium]|jgi:mannitol-1-phosphate 5-dehydrogenase|nr:mannitol dehydrogenase [Clostridiales bacterium]